MKKLEIKCWCIWMLALSMLLFASSCKSRDVSKSKTSIKSELQVATDQSIDISYKSQEKSQSVQESESDKKVKEEATKKAYKLTPVDKDKPIVIRDSEGKETLISNAIVESEDSSHKSETEEKNKEVKTAENFKVNDVGIKSKSSTKQKAQVKTEALAKETESEPLPFFWIIALIILAVITWFIAKKIKKLGWKSAFKIG